MRGSEWTKRQGRLEAELGAPGTIAERVGNPRKIGGVGGAENAEREASLSSVDREGSIGVSGPGKAKEGGVAKGAINPVGTMGSRRSRVSRRL